MRTTLFILATFFALNISAKVAKVTAFKPNNMVIENNINLSDLAKVLVSENKLDNNLNIK